MTVKQIAGQLGVSRSTVNKMLEDRLAAPIWLPVATLAGRREVVDE